MKDSASRTDIVVIGAGPAGLTAAITAARAGASVVLIERMPRPAIKLLSTGGGRCNVTNTSSVHGFMDAFGRDGRFMRPVLEHLDGSGLCAFLSKIGVPTHVPDDFHVFPVTNSARTVRGALLDNAHRLGVRTICNVRARSVVCEAGGVVAVDCGHLTMQCRATVIATGGCGYPETGSSGDGYELATGAGHHLVEPTPALVPLVTKEAWPNTLAGVSLPDTYVCVDLPRYRKAGRRGPMLFTHEGLSGPAILDLSGDVAELLGDHPEVPLRMNLLAAETPDSWLARFARWQEHAPSATIVKLLSEHVPRSVASRLCELAGGVGDRRASGFSSSARRDLAEFMCRLRLVVVGTSGFAKAMVTRGGVPLGEIAPGTMASRVVAGLYFAGEVVALDGPCGGYNLQWAFSSGALAGVSAATSLTS